MSKDDLICIIQKKHRQLERYLLFFEKDDSGAFAAGARPKFGREEMLQPGVIGDWSLRDVLVHLIHWEQRFIGWYEAGLRDGAPEALAPAIRWDDAPTVYLETPAELRERPVDAVLADFSRSYQHVLETVSSISEEQLFSGDRYAWTGVANLADYVAFITCEHYDWAKKHIRRWRRTHAGKYMSKQAVLERIRTERKRLEKNLAELTTDEAVQAGVIGEWSVKDILAHLVDWEQRFLDWYEAGLRGKVPEMPAPGLGWGDLHILNQQIYEKHRDRAMADVLNEFRRSYEQVLTVVEGISEDDMLRPGRYAWLGNSNLLDFIMANTANHYRWAKTQIRNWMKRR